MNIKVKNAFVSYNDKPETKAFYIMFKEKSWNMEKKEISNQANTKKNKKTFRNHTFYTIIIVSLLYLSCYCFYRKQYLSFDVQVGSEIY